MYLITLVLTFIATTEVFAIRCQALSEPRLECEYGRVVEQKYEQVFTVWKYMPNWLGNTPDDQTQITHYYPTSHWYSIDSMIEECPSCP
jgi:hypothetical protein